MRHSYTKTKKRVKKSQKLTAGEPLNITELRDFFKDENAIKATLSALADLKNNYGWRVIQTYLNETKKHLIEELMRIDEPDMVQKAMKITRIQDQIYYIDTLLGLPQFIIDGYQEVEGVDLDPYQSA